MTGRIGQRVQKIGGSFQHTGTVVAVFQTTLGAERLVLEFDPPVAGMLHIYRMDQIEEITEPSDSGDPIVEAVRAQLLERSLTGQRKYGTTLMRTDLDTLDWVRHAQEEALDFALYLERLHRDLQQRVDDGR